MPLLGCVFLCFVCVYAGVVLVFLGLAANAELRIKSGCKRESRPPGQPSGCTVSWNLGFQLSVFT